MNSMLARTPFEIAATGSNPRVFIRPFIDGGWAGSTNPQRTDYA